MERDSSNSIKWAKTGLAHSLRSAVWVEGSFLVLKDNVSSFSCVLGLQSRRDKFCRFLDLTI